MAIGGALQRIRARLTIVARATLAAAALAAAALLATSAAKADTFDFSYAGSGISAMGTFTATLTSPGQYTITGIIGERNGAMITGLAAPGGVPGFNGYNDNVLYFPANPELDDRGFAYAAGGIDYDVNYFYGYYHEGTSNQYGETFSALSSFGVTPVPAPIPGGGLLSFLVAGAAALAWRRETIIGVGRKLRARRAV